jgi:hypothetical protein
VPENVVVELLVDEGVDLGSDLGKNDQAEMLVLKNERSDVVVVPVWVDPNPGQRDPPSRSSSRSPTPLRLRGRPTT